MCVCVCVCVCASLGSVSCVSPFSYFPSPPQFLWLPAVTASEAYLPEVGPCFAFIQATQANETLEDLTAAAVLGHHVDPTE